MKRYLVLPVLAFLGGLFFAAASYSSAADEPVTAGTPPPVVAGQSAVDKINCRDGAVSSWKGDNVLTYQVVSDSHADWVDAEMAREGVKSWNNQGGPYILVEAAHTNRQETDIGVVLVGGEENFPDGYGGLTLVVCPSSSLGITEAVEWINTAVLPAIAVQAVTAHETGHALGLGHSNDSRDLMTPALTGAPREICPTNLDIAALNSATDPTSIASTTLAQRPC